MTTLHFFNKFFFQFMFFRIAKVQGESANAVLQWHSILIAPLPFTGWNGKYRYLFGPKYFRINKKRKVATIHEFLIDPLTMTGKCGCCGTVAEMNQLGNATFSTSEHLKRGDVARFVTIAPASNHQNCRCNQVAFSPPSWEGFFQED